MQELSTAVLLEEQKAVEDQEADFAETRPRRSKLQRLSSTMQSIRPSIFNKETKKDREARLQAVADEERALKKAKQRRRQELTRAYAALYIQVKGNRHTTTCLQTTN